MTFNNLEQSFLHNFMIQMIKHRQNYSFDHTVQHSFKLAPLMLCICVVIIIIIKIKTRIHNSQMTILTNQSGPHLGILPLPSECSLQWTCEGEENRIDNFNTGRAKEC